MTTVEKLNELFGKEEFIANNKDLNEFQDILNTVHQYYPEISESEMREYLLLLSEEMHRLDAQSEELSEDALDDVSGGITLVGVIVIGAAIYAGYKAGGAIGKFIYNLSHR